MSKSLLVPATIHGRVLVDEDMGGEPLRLLVGFHGYAQAADEMMAQLETVDAPGWTRVSVQALNRLYRGRTYDTVANWMTRQDREQQIADNVTYVDAVLDAVVGERSVTAIAYCGFSQGVAMAFRAAVLGRRVSDAILALGGDAPPELLDEGRRFPRVLLAAGTGDRFYTPAKLGSDVAALTALNVDVTVATFEGGHEWHDVFRHAAALLLREISLGPFPISSSGSRPTSTRPPWSRR